jgi:hypothetical protein
MGFTPPLLSLCIRMVVARAPYGLEATAPTVSRAAVSSAMMMTATVIPTTLTASGVAARAPRPIVATVVRLSVSADPDHHHHDERRHSHHEDATEEQYPAKRSDRPEGQESSDGHVDHECPDEVPHELLARFGKRLAARMAIT